MGVIDLMMGIPDGSKKSWYGFLRAGLMDEESKEMEFPAQYMFKDVPDDMDPEADPVARGEAVRDGRLVPEPEVERRQVARARLEEQALGAGVRPLDRGLRHEGRAVLVEIRSGAVDQVNRVGLHPERNGPAARDRTIAARVGDALPG